MMSLSKSILITYLKQESMFMINGKEELSGMIGNIDIDTWNSVPQEGKHLCMLRKVFEEVHKKLL